MNTIKLSVIITTYNQENYIKKAIDSVISQRTDFQFEIIVSDDCSTDTTPVIVKEMAEKFPHIIKPIYRDVNVGISKNWYETLLMAKGDYVTTLEGDDYWTNEDKLQKQIDFLQINPQYIGVSHKRVMADDNGKTYRFFSSDCNIKNNIISLNQFAKGYTFSYTACVHKNIFYSFGKKEYELVTANRSIADFQLCLLLLVKGPIYVMPDSLAVYRISGETQKAQSYTSSCSVIKKLDDAFEVINKCEKYEFASFNFNQCYCAWAFMPFLEFLLKKDLSQAAQVLKKLPLKAKMQIPFVWWGYLMRIIKFKLGRSK